MQKNPVENCNLRLKLHVIKSLLLENGNWYQDTKHTTTSKAEEEEDTLREDRAFAFVPGT